MIDESTARWVLNEFGLSESLFEWMRPLSRGTKGASARVRANGSDWVLKSHTPTQANSRIVVAHHLELLLAEAAFPVAPLQRTTTGCTLVGDDSAQYSLHGWVHGQHATISARDRVIARRPGFVREIATALATMHKVALSLEPSTPTFPIATVEDRLEGPARTLRKLQKPRALGLSPWHRLHLKPRKTAFDRWIIVSFPRIAQEADAVAQSSLDRTFQGSQIIIVHNDINWENLVFDEQFRLRALLDFDNVTWAPREVEVGAAAVVLAGAEPRRVDEFVTAYQEAAGVSIDQEALALGMRLKCTQSLTHSIARYLTDRTVDTVLLEPWCRSLYAAQQALRNQ